MPAFTAGREAHNRSLKKQHSGPVEESGAIHKAGGGRLKIALAFPKT